MSNNVYTYIYICIYVYIYVDTYIYVCAHASIQENLHIRTSCMYMYLHADIHTVCAHMLCLYIRQITLLYCIVHYCTAL